MPGCRDHDSDCMFESNKFSTPNTYPTMQWLYMFKFFQFVIKENFTCLKFVEALFTFQNEKPDFGDATLHTISIKRNTSIENNYMK